MGRTQILMQQLDWACCLEATNADIAALNGELESLAKAKAARAARVFEYARCF